jgi:tRNA(Ile)-lysidine synthase
MLLLARAAELPLTVHHVDHHSRSTSTLEAEHVKTICASLGVECVVHDVVVEPGGNFEARARSARRTALPAGALTAHSMDDLAETVLLNSLRGAGDRGLSSMVGSDTKPVLWLRRQELADVVRHSGLTATQDPTNLDMSFMRNRVRHELIPMMNDVARRDVVPLLARQATIAFDEQRWIDEATDADRSLALTEADCRELRKWPVARLRRWLRRVLVDQLDPECHPPSYDEVARAIAVIYGEAVACELSGARRLARRDQRLYLA